MIFYIFGYEEIKYSRKEKINNNMSFPFQLQRRKKKGLLNDVEKSDVRKLFFLIQIKRKIERIKNKKFDVSYFFFLYLTKKKKTCRYIFSPSFLFYVSDFVIIAFEGSGNKESILNMILG